MSEAYDNEMRELGQKYAELSTDCHKPIPPLDLPVRPRIVCLCGSTRFWQEFQAANYLETMAGKIVLTVGFYPHAHVIHGEPLHGQNQGCTPEQKIALDALHLKKIDLADEVLILNVGGYIGESTSRELAYATKQGKEVRFLEPRT